MLATDDQLARRAALYYEIELMGTIGILKTCVQSKLLSRIDAQLKLDEMIAAGYYSPVLKLDFD
jgi:predicted nucleic acid-binding protein